jgi:hypothetical protein
MVDIFRPVVNGIRSLIPGACAFTECVLFSVEAVPLEILGVPRKGSSDYHDIRVECVHRDSVRKRAGGTRYSRLKAWLNAASDSYPTLAATSATLRLLDFSICAPSCCRHRVKYDMGGSSR